MNCIVFPNVGGGVCIIHPLEQALSVMPIEEIAKKDTPFGLPYLIVPSSDIPSDRTFRDAWEADFTNPDGYGLGAQRYFIAQARAEISAVELRVPPALLVAGEGDDPANIEAINASKLAAFAAANAADIERANAVIAQMTAEIVEIEGALP